MDMNCGTWNVRSLNWSGTLETVDRELAMYRSDLLGVQKVVLGKGVNEQPEDYMYRFYGKEMKNHQLGTGFLLHQTYQQLNDLSLLVIGCNI